MHMPDALADVPLERHARLGEFLGIELLAQRDDLLPFPLAGNKVRKLAAELGSLALYPDLLITSGAINSNHCRTAAILAAQAGTNCHLVLHGSKDQRRAPALALLTQLGATTSVVEPAMVEEAIGEAQHGARRAGRTVRVIPGGCHSQAGARAYAEIGTRVIDKSQPDFIFLASGTGATHGGLAAAAARSRHPCRVIGISVARDFEHGVQPVQDAASWAGERGMGIHFDDDYRAGGYGRIDEATYEAMRIGWRHGLPLDGTYTGKAFTGLMAYARRGDLKDARVLFWHTGGLWNYLDGLQTQLVGPPQQA